MATTVKDVERLIQGLVHVLPNRVYVKDADRRFVYCNDATVRALNCKSVAEVIGKRDEDFFAGSHLQEAIHDEERLLSRNGPKSLPTQVEIETWKDGRLTRVVTSKQAWIGKHGSRMGIIGFSHELDPTGAAKIFPKALDNLGNAAGKYLGTYLTRLRGGADRLPPLNFGLTQDVSDTWMDQVFKEAFPGDRLRSRMSLIEARDRKAVLQFLNGARDRGAGYHDSITFRARIPPDRRGRREVRATGVVYRDRGTKDRYFCVEHREVKRGLGREALSYEILRRFPGYIFVKDRKRRFVYMNHPLLSRFGLKDISELARKAKRGGRPTDKDLGLPAWDRKVYERGDSAILDDGEPMHISDDEVIHVASVDGAEDKGQKTFISTIKMPVPAHWFDPDEPRGAVYVLGIAWETNAILRKLHDKQLLWDTLLENAAEIIYSKDIDGKYQEVSASFVDLRGWPKKEIVGHTASQVWADDEALVGVIREEDRQMIQEKQPLRNIPRVVLRKKGSKLRVRSHKFPILDESGQVRLILGISRF